MSEQFPSPHQPQEIPPIAPELEGWHGVAAKYKTWHEGLHPHVENNLDRLGLSHLIDAPADTITAPYDTVEANETIDPTQEIQEALEDANTVHVDALMNSRTFLAHAKDAGVDVDSQGRDNPEYWDLLASVTDGYADFRRRKGDSELTVESLSLICKLPQFLIAQQRLDIHGDDQYDLRGRDKEIASTFNAHLREFFTDNPDTSIGGFKKELSMITGYMFNDVDDRKRIIEQLNDTVRGAMHESAFGQILERSGYARTGTREATAPEDLQGIDIVIDPDKWDELCLDVKASKFKIRELAQKAGIPNWNRPFFPKLGHNGYRDRQTGELVPPRKDVIVIFSLLEDAWFGDRFALSDEHIDAVAQMIPDVIEESKTALHNMYQQRNQRRHGNS